ncbi:MAG: tetratricopeptide repeat protein [Gammaproteobacteria bacterium]
MSEEKGVQSKIPSKDTLGVTQQQKQDSDTLCKAGMTCLQTFETFKIQDDLVLAQQYFRDAIKAYKFEQGDPEAYFALAEEKLVTTETQLKTLKEIADLKIKAKKKDVYSQLKLANIFIKEKDTRQALNYFHKAASSGNYEAQFRIGALYEDGQLGLKKDLKKAIKYFLVTATQGSDQTLGPSMQDPKWKISAKLRLAMCYQELAKEAKDKDDKQKFIQSQFNWLSMCAKEHESEMPASALYTLGKLYSQHHVLNLTSMTPGKRDSLAEYYYKKAIAKDGDQGYTDAMIELCGLYTEKRCGKTLKDAIDMLAFWLDQNEDADEDADEARKNTDEEIGRVTYCLAVCYKLNDEPKDFLETLKEAAEKNEPKAFLELGEHYEKCRHYEKAQQHYKKAIDEISRGDSPVKHSRYKETLAEATEKLKSIQQLIVQMSKLSLPQETKKRSTAHSTAQLLSSSLSDMLIPYPNTSASPSTQPQATISSTNDQKPLPTRR